MGNRNLCMTTGAHFFDKFLSRKPQILERNELCKAASQGFHLDC